MHRLFNIFIFLIIAVPSAMVTAEEFRYAADRIGSTAAGGVPSELSLRHDDVLYRLELVGKGDRVGALVSCKGHSAYNVQLTLAQLKLLANLSTLPANEKGTVQFRYSSTAEFTVVKPKEGAPLQGVLDSIIRIYRLPSYRILHGDTLQGVIRRKYNNAFTVKELLAVNPGLQEHSLQVGMTIKIPKHN